MCEMRSPRFGRKHLTVMLTDVLKEHAWHLLVIPVYVGPEVSIVVFYFE